MHSTAGGQRTSFFPRADAAVLLQSKYHAQLPRSRPTAVAPILDVEHAGHPLAPFALEAARAVYPLHDDPFAPAPIPRPPSNSSSHSQQQCSADRYLFPVLTPNERLRLTMLFYYTRGALEDDELQSRLLDKVNLAWDTAGWEFVIVGLLDHNTYTRLATVGLPLAVLPRRESTCAHTVNQPPGKVFSLLNMAQDWRFSHSPHVEVGGLRAYAGVPLRFETEFGDHVAFGSLCVASNSPQASLDKSQQRALARLADWIVSDIVHSAKARRQRQRRWMLERLALAEKRCSEDTNMVDYILDALRKEYPSATVGLFTTTTGEIPLDGGTVLKTADLEHGLWEDTEYFDHIINERNHQDMVAPRVVRVISTQCASQRTPTFLLVGSKDFRDVFDDIDSWFVIMCAGILCRYWQNRALKEALDIKETFLRGITHQLRTPIHGILGSVELLSEDLKSRNVTSPTTSLSSTVASEVETLDPYVYIKTIRSSAKDLISTVNSLIKLNQWAGNAQTERDSTLYKIKDIEAALLDASVPALPEDMSSRPSIIIFHDLPQGLDMLSLDLSLLVDCIQPLVANAIQTTPADGIVAVTLSFSTENSKLTIDVEDNRNGVAADNYEKIFAAYETVDSHTIDDKLGLLIAYKSAKLMNGSISLVSSETGDGSHFRAAFDEITCASSFPPQQSIKQRFEHLPTTFHELSPPSTSPSLRHSFTKFLTLHDFAASEECDGSLVLLDYTQHLAQSSFDYQQLSTDQVAICLIPESTSCLIDFQSSRVYRVKNIIYAKAPLLETTFEEALELANMTVAELTSSSADDQKQDLENENLDTVKPELPLPVLDNVLDSQHQEFTLPSSDSTERIEAFKTLHIGESMPKPSLSLQIQSSPPMTLLVDDNAINLRILEMYCKRRSIPYRSAKDGNEAVRLFSAHRAAPTPIFDPLLKQELTPSPPPFDLVLMDLQMPVCDGISSTHQIRELELENGWDRSVISIITGQDSPSDRTAAEQAGADGYLVKPVEPKALDRWIKQRFPGVESIEK